MAAEHEHTHEVWNTMRRRARRRTPVSMLRWPTTPSPRIRNKFPEKTSLHPHRLDTLRRSTKRICRGPAAQPALGGAAPPMIPRLPAPATTRPTTEVATQGRGGSIGDPRPMPNDPRGTLCPPPRPPTPSESPALARAHALSNKPCSRICCVFSGSAVQPTHDAQHGSPPARPRPASRTNNIKPATRAAPPDTRTFSSIAATTVPRERARASLHRKGNACPWRRREPVRDADGWDALASHARAVGRSSPRDLCDQLRRHLRRCWRPDPSPPRKCERHDGAIVAAIGLGCRATMLNVPRLPRCMLCRKIPLTACMSSELRLSSANLGSQAWRGIGTGSRGVCVCCCYF